MDPVELLTSAFGVVGALIICRYLHTQIRPLISQPELRAHARAQSEKLGVTDADLERHGWKPAASKASRSSAA